jgi:hypothetical protein
VPSSFRNASIEELAGISKCASTLKVCLPDTPLHDVGVNAFDADAALGEL